MTTTYVQNELAHFTGSETIFKNRFYAGFVYTEGIKYAMSNGMQWLCSDVMIAIRSISKLRNNGMIVVKADPQTNRVDYYGDEDTCLYSQDYMGMDLIQEQTLFVCWADVNTQILMLPSEY